MATCSVNYGMVKENSMMNVLEKLKILINKNHATENICITLDTSITDDLHLDSLDIYEMILEIEDEFKITISEEKFDEIDKIEDVVKLVEEAIHCNEGESMNGCAEF